MMFAVSTTAFRSLTIEEAIAIGVANDLTLEFSSGIPHREDMLAVYRSAECRRLVHNYFPAPRESFVLNLASVSREILSRSRAHCEHGLELARAGGAPFYSVHAGFCLDPSPQQLGDALGRAGDRPAHWATFLESLALLLPRARALGCELLIENNVVAAFNVSPSGEHPLLCVEGAEIARLFEELRPTRGLGVLLDTGHLRVSARTLGFLEQDFLDHVAPFVRAIHHSSNDGYTDSNEPLGSDYWFLEHMGRFAGALHILEVHDQSIAEIETQRMLLARACQP